MQQMLLGAIAMSCLTVSLFFLRFWRTTHDRFFLYFAASFLLEAIGRILQVVITYPSEEEPLFYLTRLAGFVLIVFAIIDKNRAKKLRP